MTRPVRPVLAMAIASLVVGIPTVAIAELPSGDTPAGQVAAPPIRPGQQTIGTGAPIRIIADAQSVTDSAGYVWQPDATFAIGGFLAATSDPIADTQDPELFQAERYDLSGYRIPVTTPGTYHVHINESENYWHSTGQRVFSVTANGQVVAANVDLARSAGFEHATSLDFDVTVGGNAVDLGFSATTDHAKVDSLTVTAIAPVAAVTPSTTPLPSTAPLPATASATVTASTPPAAPAPLSPAATPTDTASSAATTTITPMAYGAVGDGVTDDTASLQRAFDAATPDRSIVLPAGRIFAHSAVLHLRVAGLHLTGPGTLLATDEATSSVWIEADDVTLDGGLVIRAASTTHRWSAWEQMGLRLSGHTGATLRNITVEDSAAAGIYIGGADHFILDRVTVANTRADGIHMTGGSYDGAVTDPTTIETGDDGIAVVSYGSDSQPCHDIDVTGAHVLGTTGGRGMSVVGGDRISYSDFDIEQTDASGLYIAAEGAPWYSFAPVNVTAVGGQITDANTDATIDHGAIVVLSAETTAVPNGVTVANVGITDTRASASRDVGVITYGSNPTGVSFTNLTISGGPSSAYQGNTPASSYTIAGWTVNGKSYPGS